MRAMKILIFWLRRQWVVVSICRCLREHDLAVGSGPGAVGGHRV